MGRRVSAAESPPLPFTCPACGARSWHPEDARYGYCGRCHGVTAGPLAHYAVEPDGTLAAGSLLYAATRPRPNNRADG